MSNDAADGGPRLVEARQLAGNRLRRVRDMLDRSFADDFSADDWDHALGGLHVLIEQAGKVVAHAAVVERTIYLDERPFRAGYIEAMAVESGWQRRGIGTRLMARVNEVIRAGYPLGCLSTGTPGFYARSGWRVWEGPAFVRRGGRFVRSEDEDGGIMVLPGPALDGVSPTAGIACEDRSGDAW